MKKKLIKLIFLLIITISCGKKNEDAITKRNYVSELTSFLFTTDEKYLAITMSGFEEDFINRDSTYFVETIIYKTTLEFQSKYDLDKECAMDELDECDQDVIFDEDSFEILKEFEIKDKNIFSAIDFTGTYNSFGDIEWVYSSKDTTLIIDFYNHKVEIVL